jgi:nucleotide-binding universal stress UspA family protein
MGHLVAQRTAKALLDDVGNAFRAMPGKIARMLIAVDGSPAARRALSAALDLAASFTEMPELHAVYVIAHVAAPAGLAKSLPDAPDFLAAEAETELTVVGEIARERGITVNTHVLFGRPAAQILAYAKTIGADLIVAGTHGRTGLVHALLGSTSEELIRHSPVPIMTVHATDVTL